MHHRSKKFNVGEYVMVCIRLKEFQKRFQKNSMQNPWTLILSLRSNAYLFDLPNAMDISHVFNVEDLLLYRDTFEPSTLSSSVSASEASKGAPTVASL